MPHASSQGFLLGRNLLAGIRFLIKNRLASSFKFSTRKLGEEALPKNWQVPKRFCKNLTISDCNLYPNEIIAMNFDIQATTLSTQKQAIHLWKGAVSGFGLNLPGSKSPYAKKPVLKVSILEMSEWKSDDFRPSRWV